MYFGYTHTCSWNMIEKRDLRLSIQVLRPGLSLWSEGVRILNTGFRLVTGRTPGRVHRLEVPDLSDLCLHAPSINFPSPVPCSPQFSDRLTAAIVSFNALYVNMSTNAFIIPRHPELYSISSSSRILMNSALITSLYSNTVSH